MMMPAECVFALLSFFLSRAVKKHTHFSHFFTTPSRLALSFSTTTTASCFFPSFPHDLHDEHVCVCVVRNNKQAAVAAALT
jgi:hypothetical protein